MFGVRYSSGNIRPNTWPLCEFKIDFFNHKTSALMAVPRDYINTWDLDK